MFTNDEINSDDKKEGTEKDKKKQRFNHSPTRTSLLREAIGRKVKEQSPIRIIQSRTGTQSVQRGRISPFIKDSDFNTFKQPNRKVQHVFNDAKSD